MSADLLRYLGGRTRNKAHLIPAWQDGHGRQESRCGIESIRWRGGRSTAELITAHKRELCGNCAEIHRINVGRGYVAPFYPEGLERKSA